MINYNEIFDVSDSYQAPNKPILRFPDFTNEWGVVSLNSISSQVARISDEGDYPVLTISAGNGFLEQKDRFSQVIAGNSLSKYTLLFKDELAYNRGNSKKFKYGCIYRLNDYDRALVPNVYISFRIEDGSPKFYEYLFQKKYLDRQLRQLISSSARMDGLLNISKSDFFKVKVQVTNKLEQEKIASFFTLIDKKIELQTEKVEELRNYKKGIMQKIFSQELRFKDENGNDYPEWKIGKLEEYLSNKGGTALEKYVDEKGTHNFISIGNYSVDGNYIDTGQRINLNDKTRERLLNKNDLVMVLNDKTVSGDLIGSTILIDADDKYVYNQRSERLICNSTISPYFCWILLNSKMFRQKVFSIAQGGTQIYVNFPNVKNIEIELPGLKEQEKIAHLILNLNSKLNKEQEKLDMLITYKKGLLQQMFI